MRRITVRTGLNPEEYAARGLLDKLDQAACLDQLHLLLHPDGIRCPECSSSARVKHGTTSSGLPRFRCSECGKSYTVLTNTPFWGTMLGPREIILFMWMLGTGHDNRQIADALGVSLDMVRVNRTKIQAYAQ